MSDDNRNQSDGDDYYDMENDALDQLVKKCKDAKPEYRYTRSQAKKSSQNGNKLLDDSFLRPFGKGKKSISTSNKQNKTSNEGNVSDVRGLIQGMTSDLGNDLENLNKKFNKISTVLNALAERIEQLEERDAEHYRKHIENDRKISKLQKSCKDLEKNCEELDRRSRLNKAILTCDQINVDSPSLITDIKKLLTEKMKLDSHLTDNIDVSKFGKGKHTVMLELPSVMIKRHLFRSKKEIMNADHAPKMLFINEFLTKKRAELLKKAKGMKKNKKLYSAYTFEGNVFVRESESDDCDAVIIHTTQDLEEFD